MEDSTTKVPSKVTIGSLIMFQSQHLKLGISSQRLIETNIRILDLGRNAITKRNFERSKRKLMLV